MTYHLQWAMYDKFWLFQIFTPSLWEYLWPLFQFLQRFYNTVFQLFPSQFWLELLVSCPYFQIYWHAVVCNTPFCLVNVLFFILDFGYLYILFFFLVNFVKGLLIVFKEQSFAYADLLHCRFVFNFILLSCFYIWKYFSCSFF